MVEEQLVEDVQQTEDEPLRISDQLVWWEKQLGFALPIDLYTEVATGR